MVERRSAYARQRVFIVDDHPLVREWLTNVINQQWDLTVCGESEGREGCIEAIEKKRPRIAIIDISLKDCSGFDLMGEIKRRAPQVQIMVLSMHSSPFYARRAFRAGAIGYVVKTEPTRQICKAIRDVLNGIPFVSEEIASFSHSRTSEDNLDFTLLSGREIEIFRCLGRGHSTREISRNLGISIKTVQVHCGNIRGKLGVRGAPDLFSIAVRWNERYGADLG